MKLTSVEVGDFIIVLDRDTTLVWLVTKVEYQDYNYVNGPALTIDIHGYSLNDQKKQRVFCAIYDDTVEHAALIRNGKIVLDGSKNAAITWL